MNYYTIRDIKRINKEKGYYFFSPDTMRFFRSRVGDTIFQGAGGVYFVTSEQFVGSDGHRAKRQFTVRQFFPETGDIKTVGEFNELSYYEARSYAKYYAEEGAPNND
jgi:DeoR/GlpR family transcriptional regulator of sugar metabolism